MTESTQDSATAYATTLLLYYCFELIRGYTAEELVAHWVRDFGADWVPLAVIEALYQGRYKAISVEQILNFWSRRGQALYHFNYDFERLVCRNFPQNLTEAADPLPATLASNPEPSLERVKAKDAINPVYSSSTEASVGASDEAIAIAHPIAIAQTPSPEEAAASVLSEPTNTDNPRDVANSEDANASLALRSSHKNYQANWSRWDVSKRPIHQFIPTADDSDFYQKLKAVAQSDEET
ncbi:MULTISPECIES: hypothetical protein [unclassified Coleofasciculus]|uniref:hypothetical protein n=1 Tax=Cyanophyceae TaxID=3028117 RepID=UPI0016890F0C|nr:MULTISPECIES: hypothetical protein [unclassified Coleofasciculus]MBD1879540.1 hypothetical protein [Coleofasciculus sp. FACHB-T130]MBD1892470.1 hypothetical protein [Coleofasciculus sp. FACHB-SPT9]MBD1941904.1 hypothetical protein [Coleofasciculus sp. FACHB-712]